MRMAKKQVKFIEACYKLYEQKMYYVAYSILHDEGKAEDAVQDAFIKLMQHEVHFDKPDGDDCKRYIITVIRNAAINIYNKTQRESELMFLTDRDDRAEIMTELEIDEGSDIESLVNGLPDKYHEVMDYLVLKEYTTKETAEKLGITEANVRKRYERAKFMIKSRMENDKVIPIKGQNDRRNDHGKNEHEFRAVSS